MHRTLIASAALSALATAVPAASFDTPAALGAMHEDFLMQLGEAAAGTGGTGAAARTALGLAGAHIEAEERAVLPFLGLAGAVAEGRAGAMPDTAQRLESLTAELALMPEAQSGVVGALVELFAAADAEGRTDVAQLARRMIWHETADAEVLYPAAAVVGAAVQARIAPAGPGTGATGPGPLFGSAPMPMMGVGNPHPVTSP